MRRLLCLVLLVLLAVPAFALAEGEPCASDADCTGGDSCVREPCAACPPNETCPPCESSGTCVAQEPPSLEGPACASDADCPYAFVCEAVPVSCPTTDCAGCACPPCPEGDTCPPCDCPPCEPEPCTGGTEDVCVFHPTECATDADCDADFTCFAVEECSGGGGGCACPGCACPGCEPGQDCPPCECPPTDCECTEEPDTCTVVASYCVPRMVECASAAECPADWSCTDIGGGGDCACANCDCAACPEGETCPPCECPPCECGSTPTNMCLPPGWEQLDLGGGAGEGEALGGWDDQTRAPEDPGSNGGGSGGGEAAGATEDDADDGLFGCTAAGGRDLGLLALLAAALALATRRR